MEGAVGPGLPGTNIACWAAIAFLSHRRNATEKGRDFRGACVATELVVS